MSFSEFQSFTENLTTLSVVNKYVYMLQDNVDVTKKYLSEGLQSIIINCNVDSFQLFRVGCVTGSVLLYNQSFSEHWCDPFGVVGISTKHNSDCQINVFAILYVKKR